MVILCPCWFFTFPDVLLLLWRVAVPGGLQALGSLGWG